MLGGRLIGPDSFALKALGTLVEPFEIEVKLTTQLVLRSSNPARLEDAAASLTAKLVKQGLLRG